MAEQKQIKVFIWVEESTFELFIDYQENLQYQDCANEWIDQIVQQYEQLEKLRDDIPKFWYFGDKIQKNYNDVVEKTVELVSIYNEPYPRLSTKPLKDGLDSDFPFMSAEEEEELTLDIFVPKEMFENTIEDVLQSEVSTLLHYKDSHTPFVFFPEE